MRWLRHMGRMGVSRTPRPGCGRRVASTSSGLLCRQLVRSAIHIPFTPAYHFVFSCSHPFVLASLEWDIGATAPQFFRRYCELSCSRFAQSSSHVSQTLTKAETGVSMSMSSQDRSGGLQFVKDLDYIYSCRLYGANPAGGVRAARLPLGKGQLLGTELLGCT